jgi:hypothetical protein
MTKDSSPLPGLPEKDPGGFLFVDNCLLATTPTKA